MTEIQKELLDAIEEIALEKKYECKRSNKTSYRNIGGGGRKMKTYDIWKMIDEDYESVAGKK